MSNRKPPVIRQGLLYGIGDQELHDFSLDSAQWSAWLEEQTSFRFESERAAFTVRREARLGTWYWYAYRKRNGKLTSTYVGKPEEVTLARLNAIADVLARQDEVILTPSPASNGAKPPPAEPVRFQEAGPGYELTPPLPLPLALTPIIDRAEEVEAVTALLRRADVRLVSLVGAGGIGKTRIALEVAAGLGTGFADGVYYLSLYPVRDAHLALVSVARTLGLPADAYKSVVDLLKDCLQQKQILLVLDNLEQVSGAAPLLVEVLSACPGLKMLLTSREVLHLNGEHPFIVAPLAYPDPADLPSPQTLLGYPAVALFIERALDTWTNLLLDEASIQAIARICARLEGLPLAIELAAARVKLLSPQALLERLEHSLAVLTQGGPDRPARQQTLRATLDWSHDLLSRDEQLALRRLGVFVGGCDLEAAEAVCAGPGDVDSSLLDVFSSLIDKSLLLPASSSTPRPRVRLAETVREYALESLVRSGELEAIEEAHASYYVSLAQQAAPELDDRRQAAWLEQLDHEDQNLKAALNFLLSCQDRERAVRLTGALGRYWYMRGRLSEGLSWTEQSLDLRPSADDGRVPSADDGRVPSADDGRWTMDDGVAEPSSIVHRPSSGTQHSALGTQHLVERGALIAAGMFAIHLDQDERARAWIEESVRLCEAAGDHVGFATASNLLMLLLLVKGSVAEAQAQADKMAALVHESADLRVLATAEVAGGTLSLYLGDFSRARVLLERGAALFKEAGDLFRSDLTLLLVADAQVATGDKSQAQALLDDRIRGLEARHSAWPAGYILCTYGQFALRRGDWSRARLLLERGLNLFNRLRDARGTARACLFLAQTALQQQDYTGALAMALRCLKNAEAAGAVATVIGCLEELADAAVRRGKAGWAAQLWGAGARQREAADTHRRPIEPVERAQLMETARETLGPRAFEAAWDEGRTLPLEQLLSAQNLASSMRENQIAAARRPAGLTPRELEVLLLVADGLSNNDIAERLVISPATVVSYLNLIYKKLRVSSRTAAMRYVIDHHLAQPDAG